jgi:hypothetical protein
MYGSDMDILTVTVLWGLALIVFLGPTILAFCRHHRHANRILFVNLALGWTIIGLFVAFCWAMSATQAVDENNPESAASDYGEKLFQNRNIARQADGSAIVYPALFSEMGYRLNADELAQYLRMRAAETRQILPRALITIILGTSLFLSFRKLLGPEPGTALAIITFTALFLAFELWFFVRRPKAEFREAFPDAPQAQDPSRGQRKLIASLLGYNFLISAGASALCVGLIASVAVSAMVRSEALTLRAYDGAILLIVLMFAGAGAVYFGYLSLQHAAFLARHRRSPIQTDIDDLPTDTGDLASIPDPAPAGSQIPV